MGRYVRFVGLLAGIVVLGGFGPAQAAPGDLDRTFGTGGKVTTPIGPADDYGCAVALQSDGKIVAAGTTTNGSSHDFALVRYSPTGTLDTSFGRGGKVTTPVGPADDQGAAVVIQPDGKIVAAGCSWVGGKYNFALVRYNPNGSLDASFGAGGIVTTPVGSGGSMGSSMALQPDGKIVVAGYSWTGTSANAHTFYFAAARYNTSGALDLSFGTGGIATMPVVFGTSTEANLGIALQWDGKILLAGRSWDTSKYDFALVRYDRNGSLDWSFGPGGMLTTALGPLDDYGEAVAVQRDGSLVVAGRSWSGRKYNFALARYDITGALDWSFGAGGKVITALGAFDDCAQGLAVQPDGKIVVTGRSSNGRKVDFALVRYDMDGSMDPSFGVGGKATTSFGSQAAAALSVVLQPDGRIVVGGMSHNSGKWDFALARYEGFTPPP